MAHEYNHKPKFGSAEHIAGTAAAAAASLFRQ